MATKKAKAAPKKAPKKPARRAPAPKVTEIVVPWFFCGHEEPREGSVVPVPLFMEYIRNPGSSYRPQNRDMQTRAQILESYAQAFEAALQRWNSGDHRYPVVHYVPRFVNLDTSTSHMGYWFR